MTPSCSPSQINDAIQCLRKWGWPKLDGVKAPQHRSAANGERVHKILESWLQFGTPANTEERLVLDSREYRPGLIAQNGMHHLPPPGPHLLIEREFQFGLWNGRIDFAWVSVDGVFVPREQIPLVMDSEYVVPGVGDHKTTGNMDYSLDETKLRTDPQGIIYAANAFSEFPRAKYVDELWVYYKTVKPYPSKKVHLRVARDETLYRLEPMNKLADGLVRLRSSAGLKALDLPATPEACENYGGCPHRQRCQLTPAEQYRGLMTLEQRRNGTMIEMTTDQKIAQALQQVNGVQVPMVQAPTPVAPVAAPAAPDPNAWVDHPIHPGVIWQPSTGQWVYRATGTQTPPQAAPVPAPVAPTPPVIHAPPAIPVVQAAPPVVQAAPPPLPVAAAPALPPIVPVQTPIPPLTVGPDGLPPGSINPPEARGVPDKIELAPVTSATGAQDDLDTMTKEQLQALAKSMNLETKSLREKGLKDKIRAARAGAPIGTMPSGAQVTMSSESDPFSEQAQHTDRVTQIVCAMIRAGLYTADGAGMLVAYAKQLAGLIEAE